MVQRSYDQGQLAEEHGPLADSSTQCHCPTNALRAHVHWRVVVD